MNEEEIVETTDETEVTTDPEVDDNQPNEDNTVEVDKLNDTIKKMERRINRLTAKNKELTQQLEESVSPQQTTETDDIDERDAEIARLKAQIAMDKSKSQANREFNEAGLTVSDDLLSLVVSDNDDTTADNVDLIIDLLKSTKEQAKQELLRGGKTPKASGTKKVDVDPSKMGLEERSELFRTNPSMYQQYFG